MTIKFVVFADGRRVDSKDTQEEGIKSYHWWVNRYEEMLANREIRKMPGFRLYKMENITPELQESG